MPRWLSAAGAEPHRSPAPLGLLLLGAHSSRVLATTPPPDLLPRASTTGCLPGVSPKPAGMGTLLPWSWPFSLWASLLSPSAPLWLQAQGSLLMGCAPTERETFSGRALEGPRGLPLIPLDHPALLQWELSVEAQTPPTAVSP